MRQITPGELLGLAADIDLEAERLRRLADDIAAVQREIEFDPQHARLFYKNLALKLHTFYTGCERIFQFVAAELNGAPPTGFDWHRRLLERMGIAWQGRPALLSPASVEGLREYLAFIHVVRNIYGFELDIERIADLVARYPAVWRRVEADLEQFRAWLLELADQISM